MKFLLVIILLIIPTTAISDCNVVHYVDHDEVICNETRVKDENKPVIIDKANETKLSLERCLSEIQIIKIKVNSEKDFDLKTNFIINLNNKTKECFEIENEYADLTIKNPEKLAETKVKISNSIHEIEASRQNLLLKLSESPDPPKVKISNISASNISIGYSYGYYSVKADFDNIDYAPHSVSAKIQAIGFDGHVIETVPFYINLKKRESKTVAKETMILLGKTPLISKWEATEITIN